MQQELKHRANDIEAAWLSMTGQIERRLEWAAEQIDYAERFIRLNDPRRQLKLGYSITRKNGTIVRSVRAFKPGDELETEFADGAIRSRVRSQNELL